MKTTKSFSNKRSLASHGSKIDFIPKPNYISRLQDTGDRCPIPCKCISPGLMFLGEHVFLYCGPQVFDAARILGKDAWEMEDLYVKLGENYLDGYDATRAGRMEICRYCWANSNYFMKNKFVSHKLTGGGWQ